ncbi:hypothetical protein QFX18_00025 [Saccharophagus degradans]|uniref:hypothetical protein n=1 Tax=Saccharophagus degradans TaxID=86304 RepID=UPI0024780533|nr:hypothetical protein [Saccharophagus degradans]WGO98449.1 hypothetical protein QFX18_00025 [Saccharophagus degradans]
MNTKKQLFNLPTGIGLTLLTLIALSGIYQAISYKKDVVTSPLPGKDTPLPGSTQTTSVNVSTAIEENAINSPSVDLSVINTMTHPEFVEYTEKIFESLPSDVQLTIETKQRRMENYMEGLGYFDEASRNNYYGYDMETLNTLGMQGDLLALDVLASKYLTEAKDIHKAIDVYRTAVTWGSSLAAQNIAAAKLAHINRSIDSEENKLRIENAMQWCQLATLLGDPLAESFKIATISAYEVDLSDAEWERINIRAQRQLDKFNATRSEMGLPKLDGTIPDSIREDFYGTSATN